MLSVNTNICIPCKIIQSFFKREKTSSLPLSWKTFLADSLARINCSPGKQEVFD